MEKKKIIVPALALSAILGAGAYGISQVSAYGNGMGMGIEKQAQMRTNYESRLDAAVSQGKLTEEQKKLLLAKKEEMWAEREKNRAEHMNLSVEERQAKMAERRAELEQWAKDNGIDEQYLMMGSGGMGFGSGRRGGAMMGKNIN